MSRTQQYLRQLRLVIAGSSGQGLDFSQFKVQFWICRGDIQTPNSADIRIFNLSDNTANRIQQEFSQLSLSAGYPGNIGLIFKGTIIQVRKGRLDGKDSYVDVTAADGDEAYNFAPVAVSLKAGTTPGGVAQLLATAMAAKGITQGYQPKYPQNGSVRGQCFFGMARDELREFAEQNECAWSTQNGALTFIPLTSYIPGTVPLISSATGLIGVPEQTQQGLSLRVLLNPNIKIGTCVKLDSSAINQMRLGLSVDKNVIASNLFAQQSTLKTNADSLYYVMRADHKGDTRGQEWYTDLTCLAVDASVPMDLAQNALIAASAESIPVYSK